MVKKQKVDHYFAESLLNNLELWSCSPRDSSVFEHPVANSPTAIGFEEVVSSGNLISSQESLKKEEFEEVSGNLISTQEYEYEDLFLSKSEVNEMSESQAMIHRGPTASMFPSLEVTIEPSPIDGIDLTGINRSQSKEDIGSAPPIISEDGDKESASAGFRYIFADPPPSRYDMEAWMLREKIKPCTYLDPFYSDPKDKTRPMIYAGREFRIPVKDEERLKSAQLVPTDDLRSDALTTVFKNRF